MSNDSEVKRAMADRRKSLFVLCKFNTSYSTVRFRCSMLRFLFIYLFGKRGEIGIALLLTKQRGP